MSSQTNAVPAPAGRHGLPPQPRPPRQRWSILAAVAVALVALVAVVVVVLPRWQEGQLPMPPRSRVASGTSHTCALTTGGGVKCWGANHFGQLGNGSTAPSAVPVDVRSLEAGVVGLSGSGNHTCALTGEGTVKCWGANESGQLGNGSTDNSGVPVDVAGLGPGVLQVSAGASHTCALTRSRTVLCWGTNGTGELGTGGTEASAIPVPVKGLPAGSTAVDVGNGFTCVVFTGSTVRCWGDNGDGQLGTGDRTGRLLWETVSTLPPSSVLSVGDAHACAVASDGAVACWGTNRAGQLGISMAGTGSLTPIVVPGLPQGGVTAVSAGYNRTCGVASGSVVCWGGAMDAAAAEKAGPQAVAELKGVTEVSVGTFHACAATAQAVSCWGENSNGQLGDGTTSASEVPVVSLVL